MRNLINSSSQTQKIIWLLAILGGLFATRVMYIQHGWINNDSTLYFEIAKRFSQGEYRAGWTLFEWPFYPFLIACLHKLTHLNLHVCAQILTVIFFSLTTYSLSKIIDLMNGNTITIICGIILLFGNTYISGDVLGMLLRDQGFWAFFLLSLFFFIRYTSKLEISDAVYWQISILIAILFRIEAVGYAALLPVTLLFQCTTWKHKLKQLLYCYVFFLLLIITLIIVAYLNPSFNIPLGRIKEIVDLISKDNPQSISNALMVKINIFGNQVLGSYLDDYAMLGLLLALTGIVIIKCIKITGVSGLLLVLSKKDSFINIEKKFKIILIACVMIALLNAYIIIIRSFVLSSRYVVALCFIAIIFAAFHFSAMLNDWKSKNRILNLQTLVLLLITVITIYGIIRNITSKHKDYNFEQDAVAWVKQNIDSKLRIHYDSARLRYYADAPWLGRTDDDNTVLLDSIIFENKTDCIVARVEHNQSEKFHRLDSLQNYRLLKVFEGKSKTKILILCK
jgi:hypothetical protein